MSRAKVQGWSEQGGSTITVNSTTYTYQESFVSCTVTVYLAGTITPAAIYGDNIGTVKANPFTASATGYWFFYADAGRYDVRFSGGTIATPFTLGDFVIFDQADMWINVKASPYNATGDGSTDDTAAIQSAIDAAELLGGFSASGCTVYFPDGRYLISSSLTVTEMRIKFLGNGRNISRIFCNTDSISMIVVSAALFEISDMSVIGNGDAALYGVGATTTGLTLTGSAGTGANDCDSEVIDTDFSGHSVALLFTGRNVKVVNALFQSSLDGIKAGTPAGADFRGLEVRGCRFHSMGTVNVARCINIPGATNFVDLVVEGNYCDNSNLFISGYAANVSIKGNHISRAFGGILIDQTGHAITMDRQAGSLVGNTVAFYPPSSGLVPTGYSGISVAGGRWIISENDVEWSPRHGIALSGLDRGTVVEGNRVYEAGVDAAATYDGIYADGTAVWLSLIGNRIQKNTIDTRYGIHALGNDTFLFGNATQNFDVGDAFFYDTADANNIGYFGDTRIYDQSPRQHYGTAAPTGPNEGRWTRGDIIWNTSVTTNAPVGWICIGNGTPGTWEPFGVTGQLSANAAWDPASIADGEVTSTTMTVTGAVVGNSVAVGFSGNVPAGALLCGSVTAASTVTVTLFNKTGGALDLPAGTIRADVWKH
jgi:hypothetical protein